MKIILLIFTISLALISASAQESFYYCGSQKIPLSRDYSYAVVFSPKDSKNSIRTTPSIKIVRHIYDDNYDLTVISQNKKINFSEIQRMMPKRSPETFVSSCYKDEYGKLAIPTGLIYVELKTESDFPILQQTAEDYGCRILNQNAFMPLWYTLQVTSQSKGDCVEVANIMYESGLFASAEPSFAFGACISYDPEVSYQWALHNKYFEDIDISISKAWNYSTGKGITVAVIDNGVDRTHEDLIDNISPKSYDAYTKNSPNKIHSFIDNNGIVHKDHGTHCA